MKKRIAFHTLGCKVNFYETEALAERFKALGYEIVDEREEADVYVINTCTVTAPADRKSRQFVRRMKKQAPEAVVAAVGCYAQVSPEAFEKIPEVDLVLGTGGKSELPERIEALLEKRESERRIYVRQWSGHESFEEGGQSVSMAEAGRTRAFVKIEDGCDRFCTYCVIPYARGPVRSRDPEAAVAEVKRLVDTGFKEIVLSGINTALYGSEKGFAESYGLAGEEGGGLEYILEKLEGLSGDFRVRLSSLEPAVVNAAYVERLFRFRRLCRHLHLSAQSGSDAVLKRMGRPYTRAEYLGIVQALKSFDPDYGISTDIIAGFPGETEDEFAESLSLIREAGYVRTHAFGYSARKGTAAAKMQDKVSAEEKARRVKLLIEEGKRSSEAFLKGELGKRARVLVEEKVTGSMAENEASGRGAGAAYEEEKEESKRYIYTGYSDNYTKVYIESSRELCGSFIDVELESIYEDGVKGKEI